MDGALSMTLMGLLAAVAVVISFCVAAFARSDGGDAPGGSRFKRRLSSVRQRSREGYVPAATTRSLARRDSTTPEIDKIARRWLPNRDALAVRLAQTGKSISIGQCALVMLGTALFVLLILWGLLGIGLFASLLVSLLVGITLPHYIVRQLGKRRMAAFLDLFPDSIDLMVRALRSGLPISEAIVGAANEIGDPIGYEFRQVESGLRLGRDLESLLWDTAKRIELPEFRFFIIALSVQRETGGNLAETLANLSDVLRRRRQMQSKTHAMSSEARASTMILGSLPVIIVCILLLTSPHYIMALFNDTRGLVMCGLAFVMLVIGIFIMSRLAKFEI
jgi:tight adherence protein B